MNICYYIRIFVYGYIYILPAMVRLEENIVSRIHLYVNINICVCMQINEYEQVYLCMYMYVYICTCICLFGVESGEFVLTIKNVYNRGNPQWGDISFIKTSINN